MTNNQVMSEDAPTGDRSPFVNRIVTDWPSTLACGLYLLVLVAVVIYGLWAN